MYLLDTNICIYVMKNSYPALTQKVLSHAPSDLCISSITVFEPEYGAAKSNWGDKTRQSMQMFLALFNIIDFDSKDAASTGFIRGYLEKQGSPIGPYDVQIARNGKPVVKMTLINPVPASKRIGVAEGKFEVPDDLDAGSEDISAMLTGGDLF